MTIPDPRRKGLGRGLSALLGDTETPLTPAAFGTPHALPVASLQPSRFQPRRMLREEDLADLVQSVAAKGVLQPILVRPHPSDAGRYEIIAGERRWRAAQRAGLHDVPVVVRTLDDREAQEIALIENLQRQDLSPLDEAEGYRRLAEEFGRTQDELASAIGKSRSHVANTLRLLGLPDPVKAMLDAGDLTAGHARALLGATDPLPLARAIVKRGLNVRQVERLVAARRAAAEKPSPQRSGKDADARALERQLSDLLGLNVELRGRGRSGTLVLHYRTLDQLDDILQRLTRRTRAGLALLGDGSATGGSPIDRADAGDTAAGADDAGTNA